SGARPLRRRGRARGRHHATVLRARRRYAKAQTIIAKDAVNGYLFQLPKIGVWDAKLEGMWENSPVQATDLTGVKWAE
ncbi:MAG: hypothetical protein ABJG09_22660, partial [Nitratireductor sp.]